VCRRRGHHGPGGRPDRLTRGSRVSVVEREGRITGYSTGPSFFTHTVGQTVDDVEALIGSATGFDGPGILVPMRNAALFRFCLEHDLRVVQVMTLMTTGLYNDPAGAYLPSVMF